MAGAGSVLADGLGDKDGLLTRAAGDELWLGRCRPWQGRTVAVGVPPKVLWRWRCRAAGRAVVLWRGGECVARSCRVGQDRGAMRRLVCADAICALWARLAHAHHMLGEMPWHARWLGWSWGLAGLGLGLQGDQWTSWFGQEIRFTVQTKNSCQNRSCP